MPHKSDFRATVDGEGRVRFFVNGSSCDIDHYKVSYLKAFGELPEIPVGPGGAAPPTPPAAPETLEPPATAAAVVPEPPAPQPSLEAISVAAAIAPRPDAVFVKPAARTPVVSKNIASAGWVPTEDPATGADQRGTLEVEFVGARVYRFAEVPHQLFVDLLNAKSKGAFFAEHVKGQFAFIGPDQIAVVDALALKAPEAVDQAVETADETSAPRDEQTESDPADTDDVVAAPAPPAQPGPSEEETA